MTPPDDSATRGTPRTDAQQTVSPITGAHICINGTGPCVATDFARQLETELAAAQAEVAQWKQKWNQCDNQRQANLDELGAIQHILNKHEITKGGYCDGVEQLAAQLAALRASRGEDAERLDWLEKELLRELGTIEFGVTANGSLGVWLQGAVDTSATGTSIRECLAAAMRDGGRGAGGDKIGEGGFGNL